MECNWKMICKFNYKFCGGGVADEGGNCSYYGHYVTSIFLFKSNKACIEYFAAWRFCEIQMGRFIKEC